MHHGQGDLFHKWFNIHKTVNMIHYNNKIKYKNHIYVHLNKYKKIFEKFNIHLCLKKTCVEGTNVNTIKAIYFKTMGNIIFKNENLKGFSLTSRTIQGCPLSPLLFNLAGIIRQINK